MRINDRINAQEVRLISSTGDQVGVVSKEKALELAKNEDLDLVEIVANQSPPVCRIMDFGKYKFEQSKKAHAAKKKQKQIHQHHSYKSHLVAQVKLSATSPKVRGRSDRHNCLSLSISVARYINPLLAFVK